MKNYLIIGGSSGIGLSLSNMLASNNKVYATYHHNQIENKENINYIKYDVDTDDLDLTALPDEIHGLAYCPGNLILKPFHRFSDDDFLKDYQTQVLGAVKVIRSVLPKLKNGTLSSIVLFSTIAVQKGFTFHSLVSTSKGAIEGLGKALAAEFAPTIRVNVIAPSLTDTPLAAKLLSTDEKKEFHKKNNPLKEIGSPEDIAELANFLITEKSSWITGQILHIDGGSSTL